LFIAGRADDYSMSRALPLSIPRISPFLPRRRYGRG
jgi:hypothetical protein